MAEIFAISDTHFNHANILRFTHEETGKRIRPEFDTLEEMNETMIDRWNKTVGVNDKVYHLGDVFFGSEQEADAILSRLNGKKRLIVGNHDNLKRKVYYKHFQKIDLWRMFKDFGLLLTHVPVHPSTLEEGRFTNSGKLTQEMLNVHGHTHQNGSPEGPYRSVCVELVNYTPVNIEELRIR